MKKLIPQARTTETADTATRLLHLFDTTAALKNETFLKPLFAEMLSVTGRMTEAIRKDRVFSDLEDADAARDSAHSKMTKIVQGYAAMPTDALRLPAERLQPILQRFGPEITRQPYTVESSLIEALLTDLGATDVTSDIAALPGLAQSVSLLRDAQTDFTSKRVAYEKSQSTAIAADKASDLKKPLLDLINTRLLPYLATMKMVDEATYGTFADAAAQVVADTNAGIENRQKATEKPQNPPL